MFQFYKILCVLIPCTDKRVIVHFGEIVRCLDILQANFESVSDTVSSFFIGD